MTEHMPGQSNDILFTRSLHRFHDSLPHFVISAPLGSATEQLAIKRTELEQKCKIIEQTAIETDAELYQWILEGVTSDYATYRYLRDAKGMPCCKNVYYEQRRRFYWLLSKKI